MHEASQILVELLNSIDSATLDEQEESLLQLAKLRDFVNLPLYQQSILLKYKDNPQALSQTADALLAKALSLYNLKEHQRSFYLILINIFSFNPINQSLVKLLIANFHYLGYFELAAQLYQKFYELSSDPDCLYFAGVCYSVLNQQSQALVSLQQFLTVVDLSAPAKHTYKELIKSCQGLLKHLQA